MFEQMLLGGGFAFAAAVQPGPLQAYLISQTLANGLRRTIPAVFAPLLSDIPIAAIALLVVTQIPPEFGLVLQFLGGSFLLYLAYGAYRSFRGSQQTLSEQSLSVRQTVIKAAMVNLLNPNPYLGWTLIMGPLLARAWRQAPSHSVALLGAFYVTMILTTLMILALFARARSVGPRLTRNLVGLSAAALGFFGLYQIWNGGVSFVQMLALQR
jgi:threonine/homoserine/homoserine lactone efflux protein